MGHKRSHWQRTQAVLAQPDLQPTDKLVLMVIAHHVNTRTHQCRVGAKRLTALSGLSRAALYRSLDRLEDRKLIHRKRTGRSTIFVWNVSQDETSDVSPAGHQKSHQRDIRCLGSGTSTEPVVNNQDFDQGENDTPTDDFDLDRAFNVLCFPKHNRSNEQ